MTSEAENPLDVLVVEDERLSRMILERVLELGGHRATVVPGAAEAVSILSERMFDAVICDLYLADQDGLDICRHLRSLPGRESTLFVLLTGAADETLLCAALEAQADDALTKPVSPTLLLSRLTALQRLVRRVRDPLPS